jgi:hypothetical protein
MPLHSRQKSGSTRSTTVVLACRRTHDDQQRWCREQQDPYATSAEVGLSGSCLFLEWPTKTGAAQLSTAAIMGPWTWERTCRLVTGDSRARRQEDPVTCGHHQASRTCVCCRCRGMCLAKTLAVHSRWRIGLGCDVLHVVTATPAIAPSA